MCASQEIVHNEAIATTPPPSSTLPPLPSASPLFVASPLSPPPPPPPAPRAVRRLTLEKQQEADSPSRRSLSPAAAVESPPPPSPERAASPSVGESPQPPDPVSTASPIAYCSQYRLMEHEQQNGPPPVSAAVGSWLRDAFDGPSLPPPDRYPTPPAAPRKDQYIPNSESECSDSCNRPRAPPAYLFRDGRLLFHKTYQGRQPFTFVDTRLYQGGRHDWYGVHNERDLLWARRLNLVLEHHNIPRRARDACGAERHL